MKKTEFNKCVNEVYGPLIKSDEVVKFHVKYSLFYKYFNTEILHIISFERMRGNTNFLIRVYPTSPRLFSASYENWFQVIPIGVVSQLSQHGVSHNPHRFNCKTPEHIQRGFKMHGRRLLEQYAFPYLAQFTSFESMLPFMDHDSFTGQCQMLAGQVKAGEATLKKEIARLKGLNDPEVQSQIDHLSSYLHKENENSI